MPFSSLFPALPGSVFRVTAMVIFLLAMVIRIVMTIASTKKVVFGWPEICHFRHRSTLGEHTDKSQKPEKPPSDAQKPQMYIYTLSEKIFTIQDSALKAERTVPTHCASHVGATHEYRLTHAACTSMTCHAMQTTRSISIIKEKLRIIIGWEKTGHSPDSNKCRRCCSDCRVVGKGIEPLCQD